MGVVPAVSEWFWDGPDGERIFSRLWSARVPRGQIILIHGLGEHSGRYTNLAAYMTGLGWNVLAFDLPGHGKSGTRPGYLSSWEVLLETIETFVLHSRLPDLPMYLYGHSLGGGLALQVAIRKHRHVQGVVASSPPMKIVQQVPAWKPLLAKLVGSFVPGLMFDNGIEAELLSRDRQIVNAYLADPLANSRVSSALGLGILDIGPWLLKHAQELETPTLVMHGGADGVADISGSREFCELAGQACQLVEFPGFYHELHNDIGWPQVLATAASWLDQQSANQPLGKDE